MSNAIPAVSISSSNGVQLSMPIIGLGTGVVPAAPSATVIAAVIDAIKLGYRHFDTASLYGSEEAIGLGIREAIQLGLIRSREELFITTKLWCNSADRQLVLPALKQSLRNLGTDYVDLYLIHWPLKLIYKEFQFPIPKECIHPIDIKGVWKAMEECQVLGLTKAIGVSNFSSKRLAEILSFSTITPAVNQVEMNPVWQQEKLRDFCRANNIIVTAYSPLGAVGTSWGDNRVIGCTVLENIAKAKGKTTAQVSLRWIYEQGAGIVVKSYNTERMKANLEIFDFSLTEEELNQISQLPQHKGLLLGSVAEAHELVAEIDAEI